MAEVIKYKVIRLSGPEDQLEAQLDAQGAGGWILAALLHEPRPGSGPYLAIFYQKVEE